MRAGRWIGVVALVGWLLVSVARGEVARPEATTRPAATQPTTQPVAAFMWEARGEGATVFLLGSVHVGKPELYPLPVEIERAFDAAQTLVVEVDITRINQFALMGLMARKGMYPPGESLRDHVPAETMKKLEAYLAEKRYALDLSRFRPWAVEMTLAMLKMRELGLQEELGIDLHLLTQAHAAGKTVEELESMDFQINLLSSFDEAISAESLEVTLDHMDEVGPLMERTLVAWQRGDEAGLYRELIEPYQETPATKAIMEKVFNERNVTMTQKIEGYLKGQSPVLVVVGAGHMVGEQGIVRLLQEKGYTVQQVPASGERGTRVPEKLKARKPVETTEGVGARE